MIDSGDDDDNNELDVQSAASKENKNIVNLVKSKMGATVVDNKDKQIEQSIKQGAIPKGKRKVKKTKEYYDEKGYLVTEDYSSYEEYELPPKKEPIVKPKTIHNFTGSNPIQASKPKAQASLAAFFSKKQ